MNILVPLALMFRWLTLLSVRNEEIEILHQTGYDRNQILQSVHQEVDGFFLMVWIMIVFFPLQIVIALRRDDLIPVNSLPVLICGIVIPIFMAWMTTRSWFGQFA